MLGPRPGRKSKPALAACGLTHICTLLHAGEGAAGVRGIAQSLGCGWIWLPIAGGSLDTLRALDTEAMLAQFADAIATERQPRVYLHCSAGIHRTGFFAAFLLRLQGLPAEALPDALRALRPITADQVGADRIALAVERADAILAS